MTEFAETEIRHYCRHKLCRSKLLKPTSNSREAFCTPGCHRSFYRHRCLVCEGPLKRRQENQKVCRKAKCRNALRGQAEHPRYLASQYVKQSSEVPDFIGPKTAVVAGPPPTSNQFHCATVSDGDGYQRIEAKNRAGLKAVDADDCFTEPNWREVVSPDGVRCWVTRRRPQPDSAPSDWQPCLPSEHTTLPHLPMPRCLLHGDREERRQRGRHNPSEGCLCIKTDSWGRSDSGYVTRAVSMKRSRPRKGPGAEMGRPGKRFQRVSDKPK